jgi:REP element-mobilizing transposase RayT
MGSSKWGQVPHFNKMPANFWKMAIVGHAKGVAIPICGSGLPSAFATGYGGTSLMARGDGGKVVFENDEDRKGFLFRLAKVCVSHGWRVHAWVLMSNHIHILLEVPPVPEGGLSDAELLGRLRAIHSDVEVAEVEKRLTEVRKAIPEGRASGDLAREVHDPGKRNVTADGRGFTRIKRGLRRLARSPTGLAANSSQLTQKQRSSASICVHLRLHFPL